MPDKEVSLKRFDVTGDHSVRRYGRLVVAIGEMVLYATRLKFELATRVDGCGETKLMTGLRGNTVQQ